MKLLRSFSKKDSIESISLKKKKQKQIELEQLQRACARTSISYRPSGREISSLSAYCVCVGHEGRPRAAGPRATRVTYTYAVADKELIERPGRQLACCTGLLWNVRKRKFFAESFPFSLIILCSSVKTCRRARCLVDCFFQEYRYACE